jgi:hypothetical protein
MKRKAPKRLILRRDTLQLLEEAVLRNVDGAYVTAPNSCFYACRTFEGTFCVTNCPH